MNRVIKHILWVLLVIKQASATLKKIGALPIKGSDELKQTNEIGMFIPVMEALGLDGKTVTGDALLTQRKLAHYLVEDCRAHYVFIAKDNQPKLIS